MGLGELQSWQHSSSVLLSFTGVKHLSAVCKLMVASLDTSTV